MTYVIKHNNDSVSRSARDSCVYYLLLAILMLAFLCKSFIPAGFMPDAQSASSFIICSDDGSRLALLGGDGSLPDGSARHVSEPCSFAVNSCGVLAYANDSAYYVATVFSVSFVLQEKQFLLSAPRYAAHLTRGPPQFS